MVRVKVENDAGVPVFRPRQKTLVIPLDQPDSSVDHVYGVSPKIGANLFHEVYKSGSGYVDLGDDLRRRILGAKSLVHFEMIVIDIRPQLVGIRPIYIAIRREI